jgi:hypothetical protein
MVGIAGLAEAILGLWLFVSVFLWRHTAAEAVTSAVVGAAALVLGLWSRFSGAAWPRWTVAGLASGLFVTVFMSGPASPLTIVNTLLVATLLFGFSALPLPRGRGLGGQRPRPT